MMKLKKYFISILIVLTMIPFNIYAYSDYINVSGKSVGISVNLDGIMIVGSYEINGINPINKSGLKLGDRIIKINNIKVNNINDMLKIIDGKSIINLDYSRDNKEYNTNLELVNDNGIYKTGLYVKDTISGVGTLTYVDPETKLYGALGHEIIDKNSKNMANINGGKIYESNITGIIKSENGNPGSKNSIYNSNIVYGDINSNTNKGIFGNYTDEIDGTLYKVASNDEIKLGSAKILTVISNNEIEEFDIYIESLTNSDTKNILFSIIDKDLLDMTGGIIQGMSGSPIIQDDKIIGAVTHVVVNEPTKGYGIYITNMLEEGEK